MDPHFQHCADYLRQNDYGRYISCLFLERDLREAAIVLYAFHSKIREIPRLISDPMPGEIRVQWWIDIVANPDKLSGDPLARSLQELIIRYNLPIERIERLLQAHIFDLYNDPIPDRRALETYLGETSSCLLLLLVQIANNITEHVPAPSQQLAISNSCGHGGVFVGMVDLLKALPFHEHHQRIFIPDELSSHNRLGDLHDPTDATCISALWLEDIQQYSCEHHDHAMKAIATLPAYAKTLFNGLALSKLELKHITKHGIRLDKLTGGPSRLAMIWSLWMAKRQLAKTAIAP